MNKIVKIINQNTRKIKNILPFIVFTGFIVFMHGLIQGWGGDDYFYSQTLNEISYKQFLYNNFHFHSSRLIIDSMAAWVLHISMSLWKVMDIIIISSVPILIGKLLHIKINQNNAVMLCAVFMLYPFYLLSECGWAVTTMYYFWVVIFGVVAVCFIFKMLRGDSLKWYETLICIAANLVACNLELTNIILQILYFSLLCYQIVKKKPVKLLIVQLIIGMGEFIFALLCPGNAVRLKVEIPDSLVDFKMLSLLDKFQIGYTTTVYALVKNVFFLLLCSLLSIYMLKKRKEILYRVIALIPLIACLTLGFFENIVVAFVPGIDRIANALGNYGVVSLANFDIRSSYIPIILFGMVGACVLCSIFIIYPNIKGFLINISILAGFLSRVAMGFSPTIYRSGKRTFIPFVIILVICDCFILNDMFDHKVIGNRFKYLFVSLACVSFICTLTYIQ
jgi:hypothetical protein